MWGAWLRAEGSAAADVGEPGRGALPLPTGAVPNGGAPRSGWCRRGLGNPRPDASPSAAAAAATAALDPLPGSEATVTCTPRSASACNSVPARSSSGSGSSVTRWVIWSVGTVWNIVSAPSFVWSASTTTSEAACTSARSTLAASMLDVDSPRSAVSPAPDRNARDTRNPCNDCSAPLPTSP